MNSTKSSGGPAAAAHVRDGTDEELIVHSRLTLSGMYCRAINGVNILPKECEGISLFVNMRDHEICARSAKALLFSVNMEESKLAARNVEAFLFVNMGDNALSAC